MSALPEIDFEARWASLPADVQVKIGARAIPASFFLFAGGEYLGDQGGQSVAYVDAHGRGEALESGDCMLAVMDELSSRTCRRLREAQRARDAEKARADKAEKLVRELDTEHIRLRTRVDIGRECTCFAREHARMTRSAITAPIFTGRLGAQPLRFFRAPRPGPHLVWHAVDDLHRCLAIPRDLRRHYRQQLQRDHRKDVETIATDEGIDIIAPHWMAQGLISAMMDVGFVPRTAEADYAIEATKAWKAMTDDVPGVENVSLLIAAFRNTNRIGETS